MEYEVARNDCYFVSALIGGSSDIRRDSLNYFEQPERYFPDESGMSFTEQLQNNI